MDDGGSPTIGILVFVVLIILDFVVFGFIAAMQNLNEAAVEKLAREDNTHAKLLGKYMDKTERYAHVCQLLVLIAHMLLGFLQVPLWKQYFLPEEAGVVLELLADVVIFVVLILLVLIFGIYTPEKVASRKPDIWAMRLVTPVHVVELLFLPVIFPADALSNLLARVFGVDPLSDTDDVTEEEIISMVNEGHEQGVLLASEAEMIHNIFEFGDKEAKDIMTHRKNICALDGTGTYRETLEFIKENNYSRFPVYLDSIDNIIGVLHIKEALELSMEPSVYDMQIKDIKGLIREVEFIPETRNINTLFTMMQSAKNHLVIVVDEYGQTSGLVAMEDILEEIVGNIEDEHDEEAHMIELESDGSYMMSGMAPFDEVAETLGIDEEEEDFETLNGFLISLIDKIPNDNEVFSTTAHGYLFEILAVENKMIQMVRVEKLPEEPAQDKELAKDEAGTGMKNNRKEEEKMSGHSKFANIKHKKEKNDAAKGKIFTIIGREIAVAVKEGGPDPANNFKLAQVITKAKANNMPNDTIERGIKKAAGDGNAVNYEFCTYEGYGPSGTAIIVKCLTDNKNRTAANVRNAFTKGHGSIGTQGCVSYMFDEKGQIIIDKEECEMESDDLMMLALDAGAEDFSEEEDSYEVLTAPDDFEAVRSALEAEKIPMAEASVTMIPQNYVELTAEEDLTNINRILDLLDEDDDVQEVYHNWDE